MLESRREHGRELRVVGRGGTTLESVNAMSRALGTCHPESPPTEAQGRIWPGPDDITGPGSNRPSMVPDAPPRVDRYLVVVAGTVAYTTLLFSWFSVPAYLQRLIADVGLTSTQAGLLAGAVPLVYVPLGVVSGLLVDRVGPARSLAAGLAVVGVAQLWRGLAPDFPTLLASTLLLGVGGTAITFGLPKLVGTLFSSDETGLPTSVYLVGAAIGSAGAFAIGRPILGPALGGWRPLFVWTGVLAITYAVLYMTLVRLLAVSTRTHPASRRFDRQRVRADLAAILGHRDLRLLVLVATMYLLLGHGLQGWLPSILESRGVSPAIAGQATSLYVVAATAAVLLVPPVADRLDARREAVIVAGAVGVVGLAGIAGGGASILVAAGIVVAGFGAGSLSPLIRSIPPDLDGVGAERTGTAMGLAFAVGEVGGFGGPLLVGALYETTGTYLAGLSVLAGGATLVVVAGLALGDV